MRFPEILSSVLPAAPQADRGLAPLRMLPSCSVTAVPYHTAGKAPRSPSCAIRLCHTVQTGCRPCFEGLASDG